MGSSDSKKVKKLNNPFGLTNLFSSKNKLSEFEKKAELYKRRFYDILLLIGFACCLAPGPLPALKTPASALLTLCILFSFFDDNFYLYTGYFVYTRYIMYVGASPAYRIYSYLVVIKFLLTLHETKFRITYLPALFVFFLYGIYAIPTADTLRMGLNVIVDTLIIYIILLKLTQDEELFRKFVYVLLLGCVTSGVFGWTCDEGTMQFAVNGAGAKLLTRKYGSLGDANFAGLFYSMCIMFTVVIGGLPKWLKAILLLLFFIMLMQTVSLSAMITLMLLAVFWVILKFRGKSIIMLMVGAIGVTAVLFILFSIPQFRQIQEIGDLLIRLEEKLSYISRGRWDLLTTGRYTIWQDYITYIKGESLTRQLIGGNVNTLNSLDTSLAGKACHNSLIQSVLDFGIIGTLLIYIPFLCAFAYKLLKHFSKKKGYRGEDVMTVRLLMAYAFFVFGMTVDFYIDWPFTMMYLM